MASRDFRNMKAFVKYVVSQIDVSNGSSRVGVYTFNSQAKLEFSLNSYTTNEDVLRAIDDIPKAFGNTNTAAALRVLSQDGFTGANGDRDNIPNVAVLITDGKANMETTQTLSEAQTVKDSGIYLYAFAVKLSDYAEFQQIPSPPTSRTATFLPSFEALASYGPSYMQRLCEDCPPPLLDIVFVLDASTSVGLTNFKKMLAFVKQMVSDANLDSNGVRVGLMTYSTSTEIVFHLDEVTDKARLLQQIDRVPYNYGNTNTAEAIRTMRTQMFIKENGDREGIKNIAVIITDGISNMNNEIVPTEAELARDEGIQLIAIGINLNSLNELENIASEPLQNNRFVVDDFDKLAEVKTDLFPKTCLGINDTVHWKVIIAFPKQLKCSDMYNVQIVFC